jgi:hypothetical protein
VYDANGFCYAAYPTLDAGSNRVRDLTYGRYGTNYGHILFTSSDFRSGTAYCGNSTTDGQPFSLDNAACSFLYKGIAYDDPSVQCTAGTCEPPPNP